MSEPERSGPAVRRYGEDGLLVDLSGPGAVAPFRAAVEACGLDLLETVPGWASVLVRVRGDLRSAAERLAGLTAAVAPTSGAAGGREVGVDVVYDGPDLEAVARAVGLGTEEVVRLHAGAVYTVVMLGFSRAFPYLDGTPAPLDSVGRLATPRTRVPAGSVALAAGQTGIYPAPSPGGWHLLGRTDAVLFDPRRRPPALLAPGDTVRFTAVPRAGVLR